MTSTKQHFSIFYHRCMRLQSLRYVHTSHHSSRNDDDIDPTSLPLYPGHNVCPSSKKPCSILFNITILGVTPERSILLISRSRIVLYSSFTFLELGSSQGTSPMPTISIFAATPRSLSPLVTCYYYLQY